MDPEYEAIVLFGKVRGGGTGIMTGETGCVQVCCPSPYIYRVFHNWSQLLKWVITVVYCLIHLHIDLHVVRHIDLASIPNGKNGNRDVNI